jgi:hypothetical protein
MIVCNNLPAGKICFKNLISDYCSQQIYKPTIQDKKYYYQLLTFSYHLTLSSTHPFPIEKNCAKLQAAIFITFAAIEFYAEHYTYYEHFLRTE